ncbi:MAG: hypothetical protein ABSH32_01725 [Bryobacteraceae bacterium]
MLKEAVAAGEPAARSNEAFPARPRVIVQPPRAGFHHPAGKHEILEMLRAIGPLAIYGLRSIELVRAPTSRAATVAFGRYRAPGRIVLYEQPLPPWRLPGLIAPATRRSLERTGALLTMLPDAGATIVDWPEETLRRFMLEEVLLHEIGHHVLQQHTGKRPVRIARTRDHEAFAARFAEKQRDRLAKCRRDR